MSSTTFHHHFQNLASLLYTATTQVVGVAASAGQVATAAATAAFDLISRDTGEPRENEGILALYRLAQGSESPSPALVRALDRRCRLTNDL